MDQDQQPSNPQQNPIPDPTPNQPTPPEPQKPTKTGLLIAVVVGIVVILGAAAFALMNVNKTTDNKSTDTSNNSSQNTEDTKYQKYDVTDKTTGITFSVSFYKGASVIEKNTRTFLSVGEEGSQYSVYLGADKQGQIDCGDSPATTMRLNGASTTICYKSDNTQYGGYVTVKGTTVQLNLAGQKPISIDEAKTIMESATFK